MTGEQEVPAAAEQEVPTAEEMPAAVAEEDAPAVEKAPAAQEKERAEEAPAASSLESAVAGAQPEGDAGTVDAATGRIRQLEALLQENGIALPAKEACALPAEEAQALAPVVKASVPKAVVHGAVAYDRSSPPPVAPGGEWREFATEGVKYYYNPETGQTQWEPPPQGTQELATMQSDRSAEPHTESMQDLLHKLEQRRADVANASSKLPEILALGLAEVTEMQESNRVLISQLQTCFDETKKETLNGIQRAEDAKILSVQQKTSDLSNTREEIQVLIKCHEDLRDGPIWDLMQGDDKVLNAGRTFIEESGINTAASATTSTAWHCSLLEGTFGEELGQLLEHSASEKSLFSWMAANELREKRRTLHEDKAMLATKGLFLQSAKLINDIELIDNCLEKLTTMKLKSGDDEATSKNIRNSSSLEHRDEETDGFFSTLSEMF